MMNPATVGPTMQTLRSFGVDRLVVSVNWYKVAPAADVASGARRLRRRGPRRLSGSRLGPVRPDRSSGEGLRSVTELQRHGRRPAVGGRAGSIGKHGERVVPVGGEVGRLLSRLGRALQRSLPTGRRARSRYPPSGTGASGTSRTSAPARCRPRRSAASKSPRALSLDARRGLERPAVDGTRSRQRHDHRRPDGFNRASRSRRRARHAAAALPAGAVLRRLQLSAARAARPHGNASARPPPLDPGASPSDHPALFQATGWGHHPYWLGTTAPTTAVPGARSDWVTFADLPKLEDALDRVQRVYGTDRRLPLYLTEYGIETNPPRPDVGISLSLQATYLNQAEYIAWRDPRVRTLSQYLLQDAAPLGNSTVSSFATGLIFTNGAQKPSYAAYRLPVWLPTTDLGHDQTLEVWGCVRPAKLFAGRSIPSVQIQLDGKTVRSIPITTPRDISTCTSASRTTVTSGSHGQHPEDLRSTAGPSCSRGRAPRPRPGDPDRGRCSASDSRGVSVARRLPSMRAGGRVHV